MQKQSNLLTLLPVIIFFSCCFLNILNPSFAQISQKDFNQYWKSKDPYKQAYALFELAKHDNLDAVKLLYQKLEILAKEEKPIQKKYRKLREKLGLAFIDKKQEQTRSKKTSSKKLKNLQKKIQATRKKLENYKLIFEKASKGIASLQSSKAIDFFLINAFRSRFDSVKETIILGIGHIDTPRNLKTLFEGLEQYSDTVRITSIKALYLKKKNQTFSLKPILKSLKDFHWKVRAYAIAILVDYEHPKAIGELIHEFSILGKHSTGEPIQFLREMLHAESPILRTMAVLSLKRHRGKEIFAELVELLNDPVWQVRASVIETLLHYNTIDIFEPLIERLDKERGRLVDDIEDVLHLLTGEGHHGNATVWKLRLKAERKNWIKRLKEIQNREGPKRYDRDLRGTPYYYKSREKLYQSKKRKHEVTQVLNSNSTRLIYVLDSSSSMRNSVSFKMYDQKIKDFRVKEASKLKFLVEKLNFALSRLQPHQNFTIIHFNTNSHWWKKELVPATKENIEKAKTFIQHIKTDGVTEIQTAIKGAFSLEGRDNFYQNFLNSVDNIILISDGMKEPEYPLGATFAEIKKINEETIHFFDELSKINFLRCIRIDTVGIPPNSGDTFLGGLAAETKGTYIYWH